MTGPETDPSALAASVEADDGEEGEGEGSLAGAEAFTTG
jgi:hypothetical protein